MNCNTKKNIDLAKLTFTEDIHRLIDGIPLANSYIGEEEGIHYYFFDKESVTFFTYNGIVLEDIVELVSVDNIIVAYNSFLNNTENVNNVLEQLIAKYGEGISLGKEGKAYIWKKDDIIVNYSMGTIITKKDTEETGAAIKVVKKQALEKGVWSSTSGKGLLFLTKDL